MQPRLIHRCSNLVYQFVCHCDSRYVGRMSQRLQERIKQHFPKFTISTSRKSLPRRCKANSSSRQFHEPAIGQRLLKNSECASHYNRGVQPLARGKVLSGPRDFSEITDIINLIAR